MIKNTRTPPKKADIHILLIFRLLPNILFLKKYYPCGLFEIYGVTSVPLKLGRY